MEYTTLILLNDMPLENTPKAKIKPRKRFKIMYRYVKLYTLMPKNISWINNFEENWKYNQVLSLSLSRSK